MFILTTPIWLKTHFWCKQPGEGFLKNIFVLKAKFAATVHCGLIRPVANERTTSGTHKDTRGSPLLVKHVFRLYIAYIAFSVALQQLKMLESVSPAFIQV